MVSVMIKLFKFVFRHFSSVRNAADDASYQLYCEELDALAPHPEPYVKTGFIHEDGSEPKG